VDAGVLEDRVDERLVVTFGKIGKRLSGVAKQRPVGQRERTALSRRCAASPEPISTRAAAVI
jgi:hypothetical protein